jgi:hypothetical protein
MHLFATMNPELALHGGKKAYFESAADKATAVNPSPESLIGALSDASR